MNYQKIYNDLIEKAKLKDRVKYKKDNSKYIYYENHHIIPKCLGGSNDKSNLVLLTAKEHFICHKLLHFIYPHESKISYGYISIALFKNIYQDGRKYRIGSREYERIKIVNSQLLIEKKNDIKWLNRKIHSFKGENNPRFGAIITKETRDKIGNSNRGKKRTKEVLEKLSKAQRGRTHSEETKRKIGEKHKGKTLSKEQIEILKLPKTEDVKRKISEAIKNQQKFMCPYCGKEMGISNLKHWHLDNCKFKM